MKVMLTGGRGMLGRTLCTELKGFEVLPTDLPEGDITSPEKFDALLSALKPDAVIHCAAMTAVDRCETEQETAFRLNAFGTGNVAAACHRHGVRLIAVSTDYVFDGGADHPYSEFDRADGGHTVYGQSKFAGEQLVRSLCPDHVIARLSWLYGAGGPSFVHTMVRLGNDPAKPELKVVNDQHGNPTSTAAAARKLREILLRPQLAGTFHLTCEGEATWYEFAKEIFGFLGIRKQIIPCTTEEYPVPAKRPANSRLDKMMLRLSGMTPMPDWKAALHEFLTAEFPGK